MLESWDNTRLTELRNGITDMLLTCVSTEEAKASTSCESLTSAVLLLEEINQQLVPPSTE